MKRSLGTMTIVLLIALLAAACGDRTNTETPKPNQYKTTTAQEMYQAVADFYSIVHDRADVENGTFKLSPAKGDLIKFNDTITKFNVDRRVFKNLSENDSALEVTTEYDIETTTAPQTVSVRYAVELENGRTVEVLIPHTFTTVANNKIHDKGIVDAIRGHDLSKPLAIAGRVRMVNVSDFDLNSLAKASIIFQIVLLRAVEQGKDLRLTQELYKVIEQELQQAVRNDTYARNRDLPVWLETASKLKSGVEAIIYMSLHQIGEVTLPPGREDFR